MDKYISKYSDNKLVSAAQYITELICENKAKKENKDLHYRFWLYKEWSAFFRNQIATAHKLLKKYSSEAIIKGIKDNRSKNTYSLRAPRLESIIKEYHDMLSQQYIDTTSPNIDRKENKTFRKNNLQTKNIISKLKDLENGSSND